jgi:hypothetical protein
MILCPRFTGSPDGERAATSVEIGTPAAAIRVIASEWERRARTTGLVSRVPDPVTKESQWAVA